MAIVEIKSTPSRRGRILTLSCDVCGKHFQRRYSANATRVAAHACSVTCRSKLIAKGGPLYEQRMQKLREKSLEKYGVEYSVAAPEVREKSRLTMIERYGVENPMKSFALREKTRQTFLTRYGVDGPRKVPGVTERIRRTCLTKYGVDNPMKSKEVFARYYKRAHSRRAKAMRQATSMRNFGVQQPLSSHIVREKCRLTCIERYGVDNYFRTDEFKERRRLTWMKNLGVEHPSHRADIRRKAHETMKRGGVYARTSSTVEDEFFDLLASTFGRASVRRHVEVNGWCIDFHIEPIDLYVQFDGVYWHGLDRPIEVIQEFRTVRDRTIYGTWLRDREQDAWFEENGIDLLRVTDRDDHEQLMLELLQGSEGSNNGEEH